MISGTLQPAGVVMLHVFHTKPKLAAKPLSQSGGFA